MRREYIKIKRPTSLFPRDTNLLKRLDDDFWKTWIFFHLLNFYQNCNKEEVKHLINKEKAKQYPRIELTIAKYVRKWLRNNQEFDSNFDVSGEEVNDEDLEGFYDITIRNTYWKSKCIRFECKNLDGKQELINKYVYYDTYNKIGALKYDGGVYRFFNGKYSQNQSFGGMIGFILTGETQIIKAQIIHKLKSQFNITPEGDLLSIEDNTIFENEFTFNSTHKRSNQEFLIHHILFKLN